MRAKKSLKKAMLKCHLNLTDGTLMKIESIDINKTLESAQTIGGRQEYFSRVKVASGTSTRDHHLVKQSPQS
ncbi:MAG: hypothetical protein EXR81_05280 [Gammaproteobacteria bacterium]|nr:hypothetical protein [Gammaproteobacteria bacterium]